MALNRKYYGIKFPFTSNGDEGYFIDMEYNAYKEVKSDLMHLLFTPKGIRLRMPEFGTNLLKHIFEPKDGVTYTDIKLEIQESVKKYLPNITITEIIANHNEIDQRMVDVSIKYDINEGGFITSDEIKITI
jgi:phage baseplate assembly protein W